VINRVLACCLVVLSASPFAASFKTFGLAPITVIATAYRAQCDTTSRQTHDVDPSAVTIPLLIEIASAADAAAIVAAVEPPVAPPSAFTASRWRWSRLQASQPSRVRPRVLRL
jgi:hypothetical protein